MAGPQACSAPSVLLLLREMGRQRFVGTVSIRADESILKMDGGAGGPPVNVHNAAEPGTWQLLRW